MHRGVARPWAYSTHSVSKLHTHVVRNGTKPKANYTHTVARASRLPPRAPAAPRHLMNWSQGGPQSACMRRPPTVTHSIFSWMVFISWPMEATRSVGISG